MVGMVHRRDVPYLLRWLSASSCSYYQVLAWRDVPHAVASPTLPAESGFEGQGPYLDAESGSATAMPIMGPGANTQERQAAKRGLQT